MDNIFLQLALVLSLSCVFGFFAQKFKLPLIVSYLLCGVVISSLLLFNAPTSHGIFTFLPEIGIAFVLFLIGMELDLREIKNLGFPIILSTLVQVIISSIAGFTIASFLGFPQMQSLYLGIGLSFSSTIVVIKLLLEKRDLTSLYGKLAVGILLLEDIIAVVILMMISVGSSVFNLGLQQSLPFITLILKAGGLFLLTYLLSRFVLAKLFKAAAASVELLFLTALTWCFAFTSLCLIAGFSTVIGAFLSGVALASSPYRLQIQGRIKPLRDFFVTLFFIYLGLQLKVNDILPNIGTISLFSLYALIFKPLIFLLVLGIFGFRKHTLFQTALSLTSISEFSLVIMLEGVNHGYVSTISLSIMASVTVASIIFSSIAITYSKIIYKFFLPVMSFFEHKSKIHYLENKIFNKLEDHVIVIGAHRLGGPIVKFLKKEKIPFLVLDFNPHIIEELSYQGIYAIYGDIGDPEIIENLQLEAAKLIISTATDISDNEILLAECKRRKVTAKLVARAQETDQIEILKKMGADYVIVPETVSGDFMAHQLKNSWPQVHFNPI